MKKILFILALITLAGCRRDAQVASYNLSYDADNFKILRRVVFYNGITDKYVLTIEGYCSVEATPANTIEVTCKDNKGNFKKHFLGISDNVTYFVEHIEPSKVSTSRYKVAFRPSEIIPDVEIK